jgi:hypothetical protein
MVSPARGIAAVSAIEMLLGQAHPDLQESEILCPTPLCTMGFYVDIDFILSGMHSPSPKE